MDLHLTLNKNFHLNFLLYTSLQIIIQATLSHSATTNCSAYCGSIPLQHPFGSTQGCGAFPYKQMLQCDHKALKVHLRTASGLFEVQGIDYKTQTLTISDPSMSTCSSLNPITHQHFSVDSLLPPTPHNTILLFHCPLSLASSGLCNNSSQTSVTNLLGFPSDSCYKHCELGLNSSSSSSLPCCATDFERLGNRSLGDLQCKHYVNVYGGVEGSKWGYGIRLSFNIPDKIPDVRLCDECDRQDGNCGIGLKCICHPHECENTVVSRASVLSLSYRNILSELVFWSIFTGMFYLPVLLAVIRKLKYLKTFKDDMIANILFSAWIVEPAVSHGNFLELIYIEERSCT